MGREGEGGGGGDSWEDAPRLPSSPPAPTVYKQFINNPCTRMLSTRMLNAKFSIALYSACMPMCLCAVEPGTHYGF